MGLYAVGLVDGDTSSGVKEFVESHSDNADVVIRLPDGVAIEYAIVHDVPDSVIRQALSDTTTALQLPPIQRLDEIPANELETQTITYIKKNMLHAAFIEALPFENLPPLANTILEKAVLAAREQLTGFIQL